jgi:hypothetical protein
VNVLAEIVCISQRPLISLPVSRTPPLPTRPSFQGMMVKPPKPGTSREKRRMELKLNQRLYQNLLCTYLSCYLSSLPEWLNNPFSLFQARIRVLSSTTLHFLQHVYPQRCRESRQPTGVIHRALALPLIGNEDLHGLGVYSRS